MKFNEELKKISPSFAHYGIEGGATAVVVLRWRGASCALVGSSGGRCALYSLDACALIATLWEDPQHRSIIAVGEWQLPNESVMSSSSNASSTSSCTHVWIHFRGSAIEVFQLVENAALTRLVLTGPRIPTGHYGFCTAISDWPHNRFIVPDYEDDKTVVKIRYAGGGEKCIRMDREFLTDAYLRSGDGDAPARLHAAQLDILQPFSGMLMAMEIFHEAIVDRTGNSHSGQVNTDDAVHYLFLAFEDSTVALYNTRLKRIVDFMKHPKHHEFVCWSVAEFSGANFDAKIFFSIATMKQAYLIGFDTSRMFFEAYGVIYKSPNISTTSLAMFPSTTADRRPRVACALASGVVEIYELSLRGEAHSTSIAIDDDDGGSDSKPVFHATKCYVIDFHAGHSITALRVFAEDVRNEKPPKRDDTPKQLLVVGCNVGKLSIYHL